MEDVFNTGQTESERMAAAGRILFRLGLLGAVPLIVLALWLASIAGDHPWRAATIMLLTQYAAVVLSFLGGIRWGLAMGQRAQPRKLDMVVSLLPPLVAWASLSVPLPYTFAVLAAAYAAQGAWDAFAVHWGAAPHWYGRLRGILTAIAVATLVLAFLATG